MGSMVFYRAMMGGVPSIFLQEGDGFEKVHAFYDAHQIDDIAFNLRANPAFEKSPLRPQGDGGGAIAMAVPFGIRAAEAVVVHFQAEIPRHLQDGMTGF